MIRVTRMAVDDAIPLVEPMIEKEWAECADDRHIFKRPNVDWDAYRRMDQAGMMMVVVAFDLGAPVGYWAGFFLHDLQNKDVLRLTAMGFYLEESHRGYGKHLISAVEREAKKGGATRVYMGTKQVNRAGRFLRAIGYGVCEISYTKVLSNA